VGSDAEGVTRHWRVGGTARRARSRSGVDQFWLLVFDRVYLNIFN
jgi:hypothetical protein